MEDLLTILQVAQYLGVTERTVYEWARSGRLPAIKVGRLWRVRASDLEGMLRPASGPFSPVTPGAAATRGPYPLEAEAHIARETGGGMARRDLERHLAPLTDQLKRRLAFVGLLSDAVADAGWPPPVIVGGHAVEFYTAGDYPTVDIDLAGASEPVVEVLGSWGFHRQGRHFYDDSLGLVVEIPGGRLAPEQLERAAGVRISGATAFVIGIEDLIVDRLCACKFWNDPESCTWAAALLRSGHDIDAEYLRARASKEDVLGTLDSIGGDSE